MSLAIDVDNVSAVLLADGWHTVADQSFEIDAYEFMWQGDLLYNANAGFAFTETDGAVVMGPMTAILAVRVGGS